MTAHCVEALVLLAIALDDLARAFVVDRDLATVTWQRPDLTVA